MGIEYVLGAMALAVVVILFLNWRASSPRGAAARSEAMFRSMFPDLQPHFHPAKLVDYIKDRRAKAVGKDGRDWKVTPGFGVPGRVRRVDGREVVHLLDEAGATVAQFFVENHDEGGVVRFGKGKFTVNLKDRAGPRVRYWHPDREFKWTPVKWTFQSRMADDSIAARSSGSGSSSFSSDSSPSTTTVVAGTAAAAGVLAAGGAFDGGGASAAWDGGSPRSGGDTATAY
jgi:hypothetical protein